MSTPPPFRIRQQLIDSVHTVSLRGQLDAVSSRHLLQLLRRSCPFVAEIRLDLSEVSFIDPSGLRTLLAIKALCAEHYTTFALTPSYSEGLQRRAA